MAADVRRAAPLVLLLALLVGCTRQAGSADEAPEILSPPSPAKRAPVSVPLPQVAPESPRVPSGDERLSPAAYGAVGNDSGDDSAALQAAVDAAAENGVGVELPADTTYVLSSALDLPSGTRISGAGDSSVLKFTWRYNDPTHDPYYLGNVDQVDAGNTDITLTSFAIRGAASGLPAGANDTHHKPRIPAIRFRLVDRFAITNLDVGYAPGISIIHQGCSDGLIAHNRIHHSGRDGINGTWHKRNMHDIVITKNHITKVGDDGIAVIGTPGERANRKAIPYRILVKDNVIDGWKENPNGLLLGRGITVMASTRVGIIRNTIDHTHSAGILVAPSTRSFSFNPTTRGPWRSSHVSIADNTILGASSTYRPSDPTEDDGGRGGIVAKQADVLWLVANTIRGTQGRDVALYDCNACFRQDTR